MKKLKSQRGLDLASLKKISHQKKVGRNGTEPEKQMTLLNAKRSSSSQTKVLDKMIGNSVSSKRREQRKHKFLQQLERTDKALKRDKAVKVSGKAFGTISDLTEAIASFETTVASRTRRRTVGEKAARKASRTKRKKLNPNKVKSRKQLVRAEGNLFSQVLEHPAFQQDPCAAIAQHIKNTRAMESTHQ